MECLKFRMDSCIYIRNVRIRMITNSDSKGSLKGQVKFPRPIIGFNNLILTIYFGVELPSPK